MGMNLTPTTPPRKFRTGATGIELTECARIELAPDELVTFVSATGSEHDVVRKSWGYYATGSTNHRLPANGLRPLVARNAQGHHFILLVETGKEAELMRYFSDEQMQPVAWLDGSAPLLGQKEAP